jgi:hypothetical protein
MFEDRRLKKRSLRHRNRPIDGAVADLRAGAQCVGHRLQIAMDDSGRSGVAARKTVSI